jgi:hypothetical protein
MTNGMNRLRWLARRLLRFAPRRRHVLVPPDADSVLILFAGTYGDFVHILPMLAETSRLWPKAAISLHAPKRFLDAFAFALPPRVRRASGANLLRFALAPADLLLVTTVGVYRVRYELMALRLGRAAAGFRYAHEPYRSGFGWSVALTPEVANFGEQNQQLPLAVAARKLPTSNHLPWRARIDVNAPFPFKGPVLFSAGSAGFKKDVGLRAYLHIIDAVMQALGQADVTVVIGPEDGDVAEHLSRAHGGVAVWRDSVADLADKLRDWPGGLLGFNSFMAHFALYLGRRMAVMHHTHIPYGYDCSPFHRQLVLTAQTGYALGPLLAFLSEVGFQGGPIAGRQDLPRPESGGKKLP